MCFRFEDEYRPRKYNDHHVDDSYVDYKRESMGYDYGFQDYEDTGRGDDDTRDHDRGFTYNGRERGPGYNGTYEYEPNHSHTKHHYKEKHRDFDARGHDYDGTRDHDRGYSYDDKEQGPAYANKTYEHDPDDSHTKENKNEQHRDFDVGGHDYDDYDHDYDTKAGHPKDDDYNHDYKPNTGPSIEDDDYDFDENDRCVFRFL